MNRRISALATTCVAALVLGACAGGDGGPPAANAPAQPAAPVAPAQPAQPAPTAPPAAAAGGALTGATLAKAESLFVENCSTCHLKTGAGAPKLKKEGIPDLTSAEWHAKESDEHLRDAIANGEGDEMPAFKDELSPEDIDLIVRYIRSLPGTSNAAAGSDSTSTPSSGGSGKATNSPTKS